MENKTLAAITAAVFTYMKTQEEALALQGELEAEAAASTPDQSTQPVFRFNAWGYAGRQAQMQQGIMMQMRAFK